jgi:hypothetical protein
MNEEAMSTLTRPVGKIGWLFALAAAGALAWGLRRLLADDPGLRRLLVAAEDDEPVTPEDVAAVKAAEARVRKGRYVSFEDAFPEAAARP